MEHQNESGRETLEVFDSNTKTKGSAKEKISHSSSLRSDDLEGISQNVTRQNSISSAISGTTRPDQGRADDFFDVSIFKNNSPVNIPTESMMLSPDVAYY